MSAFDYTSEEEQEYLDKQGYCPFTPHRRCTRGKEGGYSDSSEDCEKCGERCW